MKKSTNKIERSASYNYVQSTLHEVQQELKEIAVNAKNERIESSFDKFSKDTGGWSSEYKEANKSKFVINSEEIIQEHLKKFLIKNIKYIYSKHVAENLNKKYYEKNNKNIEKLWKNIFSKYKNLKNHAELKNIYLKKFTKGNEQIKYFFESVEKVVKSNEKSKKEYIKKILDDSKIREGFFGLATIIQAMIFSIDSFSVLTDIKAICSLLQQGKKSSEYKRKEEGYTETLFQSFIKKYKTITKESSNSINTEAFKQYSSYFMSRILENFPFIIAVPNDTFRKFINDNLMILFDDQVILNIQNQKELLDSIESIKNFIKNNEDIISNFYTRFVLNAKEKMISDFVLPKVIHIEGLNESVVNTFDKRNQISKGELDSNISQCSNDDDYQLKEINSRQDRSKTLTTEPEDLTKDEDNERKINSEYITPKLHSRINSNSSYFLGK